MSQLIQTATIVRQRGQITIPEAIRKVRTWASPSSVVTIATTKHDEIVIKPYVSISKKVDWEELWNGIKRARHYKGEGYKNLSKFIAHDREKHE